MKYIAKKTHRIDHIEPKTFEVGIYTMRILKGSVWQRMGVTDGKIKLVNKETNEWQYVTIEELGRDYEEMEEK